MTEHRTPALTLDCRGKRCPLPVIELANATKAAQPGDVIRVLAEDPAAAHDIPAWCRMRGQEFLGEVQVSGVPAYDIRCLG